MTSLLVCMRDVVRFFMASLFPKVRRLLYLDNDVVISCCLEEIYYTAELNKPDKVRQKAYSSSYNDNLPYINSYPGCHPCQHLILIRHTNIIRTNNNSP